VGGLWKTWGLAVPGGLFFGNRANPAQVLRDLTYVRCVTYVAHLRPRGRAGWGRFGGASV